MTDRDRTPRRPTVDEFMAIDPAALERAFSLFLLDEEDPPETETVQAVSVVEIDGPLEARAGWWWDGYSGSYGIVDRFKRAMADSETVAVVLKINSPGGACAGLLEAVDAMRAATTKPVVAFCEGAYSAGYTLATVAERIHVSRAGGVGSIGVIATAVSYEKALEKDGVAVAVVASGSQKTDLHPALPLSDAAVGRLRKRVNELAGMIADEVARARGMSRDDVLGLQAGMFYGQAARDAGLADAVGTLDGAIDAARGMANERAADAAKETAMAAMAAILGLAATATEAEVAARAGALRDLETALASATGETNPAKIVETVRAWKKDAAEAATLRERAEAAEGAERATYITDVLVAKGIADDDEATRRLHERSAKSDWAQYQKDFPRPSPAAKAAEQGARAGDEKRLARLPTPPKVVPTEPGDDDAKAAASVGMTVEKYRETQAQMRKDGVL
jgi:signal peptide peptidase SppA